MNQVVGGWQVSTITTVQSGRPSTRVVGCGGKGAGFPHSNRLHCVAGVNPVADNPTPDRYFVREAFTNPVAGEFGNCGRNSLIAPVARGTWTSRP